jgi:hypothetical protein
MDLTMDPVQVAFRMLLFVMALPALPVSILVVFVLCSVLWDAFDFRRGK